MKSLSISLGLMIIGAAALALAEPIPSQHPRVGQLAAVTFAHGSAELADNVDATYRDKLGQTVAWAHENPEGLVVLDGHADPTGDRATNIRLSLQRAKVVRDQLITAGANPDQIVIAGFGEQGPRRDRTVVIWGTRAGIDAVVARTVNASARGNAVIRSAQSNEPRPSPR